MSSTGDLPAFADPTNLEEASNKRKRDEGDNGDREQKKVHVEEGRISMEDLHLDVGPKYKLCNTRKTPFILNETSFPLPQEKYFSRSTLSYSICQDAGLT